MADNPTVVGLVMQSEDNLNCITIDTDPQCNMEDADMGSLQTFSSGVPTDWNTSTNFGASIFPRNANQNKGAELCKHARSEISRDGRRGGERDNTGRCQGAVFFRFRKHGRTHGTITDSE